MTYLISTTENTNVEELNTRLQSIGFKTNLVLSLSQIITGEYNGDKEDLRIDGVKHIELDKPLKAS